MIKKFAASVLALTVSAAGFADPAGQTATAFVGATLIDGNGGDPVTNATVVISGDRILAAGDSAEVEIPTGAETVTVDGKYIVPGLIDAHAHFMESGRIYTSPGRLDLTHLVTYEEEIAWMKARVPVTLQSYLCAGVTGTLSAGGPKFEYEVRSQAEAMPNAPSVFVAHGPVTLAPSEILFPPFDGDTPVRTVHDPASATAMIQQASDWGADLIKSGYLGGPFAEYEQDYVAIHEAIVEAASGHGFTVTSHATELEAARNLVKAGVNSLQHLPMDAPLDDDFINLLKQRGVIVVPTLAVYPRAFVEIYSGSIELNDIEQRCGDPQVIQTWSEVTELPALAPELQTAFAAREKMAKQNATRLYQAGVPLAAGSDAGNPGLVHGASLHHELRKMADIGMAPLELISAATLNAARVSAQEQQFGSVEVGKQADFLVLNKDPLVDVANLQEIEWVVKRGKRFSQQDLLPETYLQ